jgi:hypothetical protein
MQRSSLPPGQPAFSSIQAVLLNPYASQYPTYQNYSIPRATTAEGYTLSSTYVPGSFVPSTEHNNVSSSFSPSSSRTGTQKSSSGASWYRSGNCRCTYKSCSFVGSKESLEIHRIDRHLIFPLGWEKGRRSDWDADPSLKGYLDILRLFSIVLTPA